MIKGWPPQRPAIPWLKATLGLKRLRCTLPFRQSPQRLITLSLIAYLLSAGALHARELDGSEPPLLALSSQLLMMEQIEELVANGEFSEAIVNLEKLFDQAGTRIVRVGDEQQASTLTTQRYFPLAHWAQRRLQEILFLEPALLQSYQAKQSAQVRARLKELQKTKDIVEAQKAALRFSASDLGAELQLFLSDLYLERGWSLAAIQAAQRASSELRVSAAPDDEPGSQEAGPGGTQAGSFPWSLTWRNVDQDLPRQELQEAFQAQLVGDSLGTATRTENLTRAIRRVLLAAALDPNLVDRPATVAWSRFVADAVGEEPGKQLKQLIVEIQDWKRSSGNDDWPTFAGDSARQRTGETAPLTWSSYTWYRSDMERFYAFSDRIPASQPRVAETETGTLPYFPVVDGGRVYLNSLTRIYAFDLASGQPWPDIRPALPLFDSQLAPSAFVPRGYACVGTPRATLSVQGDELYARMGSPVSGWVSDEGSTDGGSRSYLIGLDLSRQGSLLAGFPLRLHPPEFSGAEFDGAPLVWGNLLIAPIAERDNVGMSRSVAAFDRFSGELRWRTEPLARGVVEGTDRANLISHQLLSAAGGRVYYNTNLGSIACLDPLTGQIYWLTRYSRLMAGEQSAPSPNRFRYRDLTPCLIHRGLVYCGPRDCPEMFALDATTGDLVWATDDQQVADAIHLLGVHEDCFLVSGDRLVWLDRLSGRVISRFPASTTPGTVNALPSPRGLGRGLIADGRVLFPTSGEIFVFPAELAAPDESNPARIVDPPILSRVKLDARGKEGGNLIAAGDWLLLCTPNRMFAYQATSPGKPVSFRTRASDE